MIYTLKCTAPVLSTTRPPLPSVVIERYNYLASAMRDANVYARDYFMVRVINDSGVVVYDPAVE